jgi:hypothetical protein
MAWWHCQQHCLPVGHVQQLLAWSTPSDPA